VLTIDEESDVCQPHSNCDYNNNRLPIPNGNSAKLR
jgi:hypothetical protein